MGILQLVDLLFGGLTGPLQGVQRLVLLIRLRFSSRVKPSQHGSADLNGECDSGLR